MGQSKKAVIYARVSTADQGCDRQIIELKQYAERAGYDVVETYCETASGAKNDRADRVFIRRVSRPHVVVRHRTQIVAFDELIQRHRCASRASQFHPAWTFCPRTARPSPKR